MRHKRAIILRKLATKITKGQPEAVFKNVYRKLKKRWNRTPRNMRGKVAA